MAFSRFRRSNPEPPRARGNLLLLPALAVIAALLVFAPTAAADLFSPESSGSPNAHAIDRLYWYIMAVAIVIFVGVEGLLLYTLFKFRARPGRVPEQFRGNTRIEIGWTVAAAMILVVLGTLTFIKLDTIYNPAESLAQGVSAEAAPVAEDGRMTICVDGFRYGWRFIYQEKCDDTHRKNNARNPGPKVGLYAFEEMVVPAGVTVKLRIGSLDVNHAWWIPKLGGKFDATRGYLLDTWFRVPVEDGEKPGGTVFFGQCAELCGRNHANMTATVRAVSVSEFNEWAQKRRADIAQTHPAPPQNTD